MSGTTRPADDVPSIKIAGKQYFGWLQMRVTREIKRAAADFDLQVSERWSKLETPWQITPFSTVEVLLGEDVVLTGYVDAYTPELSDRGHTVRIAGRSKTGDLIDCTPELRGAEFRRSTLDALARAVCAPFGIGVDVQCDVGGPLAVAAMDKAETGFAFLERLARLRGVLLTDDGQGRLVLTRAGTARAEGRIEQGRNVLHASGELNVSRRFSQYTVRSQTGSAVANATPAEDSDYSEAEPSGGEVQVAVRGQVTDPEVPRHRPTTIMAEGAASGAEAVRRAEWQRNYNNGQSKKVKVTLKGWRQDDGRPWEINKLIGVKIPALQTDADLLISGISYTLDKEGRRTVLELGPAEGFTPEPATQRSTGSGGGAGRLLSYDASAAARGSGAP